MPGRLLSAPHAAARCRGHTQECRRQKPRRLARRSVRRSGATILDVLSNYRGARPVINLLSYRRRGGRRARIVSASPCPRSANASSINPKPMLSRVAAPPTISTAMPPHIRRCAREPSRRPRTSMAPRINSNPPAMRIAMAATSEADTGEPYQTKTKRAAVCEATCLDRADSLEPASAATRHRRR
jgi:hypothetical protein